MSSMSAKNPKGGAEHRRVMESLPLDPASMESVVYIVDSDSIRLRPDNFREPPGADPHAGWCGEGRFNAVPYPIISDHLVFLSVPLLIDQNKPYLSMLIPKYLVPIL